MSEAIRSYGLRRPPATQVSRLIRRLWSERRAGAHRPAHPYRCEYGGRGPEECAERCARVLEEAILFHGPESVSAFLAEPVSQPLGGVVPGAGYWPRVREICDRYGVLLVFDEVITGFGRLGTWFGADYFGVTPDIMSFAKGITSGYVPYGARIDVWTPIVRTGIRPPAP